MLLAAFFAGALMVVIPVGIAGGIEHMAQRGERIYRARHRDHSRVPSMVWMDCPCAG